MKSNIENKVDEVVVIDDTEIEVVECSPKPEIKVIEWISYRKAEEDLKSSIGSWGGGFKKGMRWKDYFDGVDPELKPYVQAIFDNIKLNPRKYSGYAHMFAEDGAPLFSDGKCGLYSPRGWSDLMAAIWSELEDKDYSYLDYYLS